MYRHKCNICGTTRSNCKFVKTANASDAISRKIWKEQQGGNSVCENTDKSGRDQVDKIKRNSFYQYSVRVY